MQLTKPKMKTFVRHTSCDKCGSSDGNGVYSDQSTWCFSCESYGKIDEESDSIGDGERPQTFQHEEATKQKSLLQGVPKAIAARGLTEEACRKFGYLVGKHHGEDVQIDTYKDDKGRNGRRRCEQEISVSQSLVMPKQ